MSRVRWAGKSTFTLNLEISTISYPPLRLPSSGEPMTQFPATLHNGTAVINAQVTGKLAAPRLSGNAALTQFSVEQRNFDRLAADFAASPSSAAIQNGILARSSLQAHFSGAIGLRKWSTTPQSPLSANVTIRNADVADVMALAGQPLNAASGSLAADAQISGTLGNPVGGANLSVGKGLLYGEPFDSLNVNAAFSDQLAELQKAELVDGPSQVTLHATFVHPRDSFSTGHIQAELSSNEWALSRLQTIQSRHPGLAGSVQLNASTAADVQSVKGNSTIAVRSLDADLAAHNLRDQTQTFGDLTGTAKTSGNVVNYNVHSDFTGSTIQATGHTQLTTDYPTTADLSIANLNLKKVLQVAGREDLPVSGTAGMEAHLEGTLDVPRANVGLTLNNAKIYDEPLNRVTATIHYTNELVDLPSLQIDSPAGHIALSGSYAHPAHNFDNGTLQARVNGNNLQLAKIVNLQKYEPGLSGTLHLTADAAASMRQQAGASKVFLTSLNTNLGASGLTMNNQSFGDMTLTSETRGTNLSFRLDSDFAQIVYPRRGRCAVDRHVSGKGRFNLQQRQIYKSAAFPVG